LTILRDGADGNNVGLAWMPTNIEAINVTRSTSRTAYYEPVQNRSNLQLLVNHYVLSIEFDKTQAVGATVVSRATGEKTIVRAKKEVILAAGAVNTARTLQLSGIGPSDLLTSLGINVIVDAPGVGSNFQDHPFIVLTYNCESYYL